MAHSYSKAGTYNVTLTITDRGGNSSTLYQTIEVLGSNGQPGPPSNTGNGRLQVRLQLLPQGLRSALEKGVNVRVTANERAEGIAYVSVPKALAKRAGLKTGRSPLVVVGVGTIANVRSGSVTLHLRLSRQVIAKLARLHHVTLTIRLALVDANGNHVAIDAAGRY